MGDRFFCLVKVKDLLQIIREIVKCRARLTKRNLSGNTKIWKNELLSELVGLSREISPIAEIWESMGKAGETGENPCGKSWEMVGFGGGGRKNILF